MEKYGERQPVDVLSDQYRDALRWANREREVYLMSRRKCIPYPEIAIMVGVQKGTLQKVMERAEKKMMERKDISLICVG